MKNVFERGENKVRSVSFEVEKLFDGNDEFVVGEREILLRWKRSKGIRCAHLTKCKVNFHLTKNDSFNRETNNERSHCKSLHLFI